MTRLNQINSLLLLLLIFSSNTSTATADELHDVRKQFSDGLSSEASNENIHDRLQQLLVQEPDNPLLLAYYGSSETLMGKYAWMPWSKLSYVNDGIGHIQRALRLAGQQNYPSLNEVQLIAASTYVSLPDRFNTFDSGLKLLTKLLQQRPQRNWSDDFLYSLYRTAAKAAGREGDTTARAKWQAQANVLASDKTKGEIQP